MRKKWGKGWVAKSPFYPSPSPLGAPTFAGQKKRGEIHHRESRVSSSSLHRRSNNAFLFPLLPLFRFSCQGEGGEEEEEGGTRDRRAKATSSAYVAEPSHRGEKRGAEGKGRSETEEMKILHATKPRTERVRKSGCWLSSDATVFSQRRDGCPLFLLSSLFSCQGGAGAMQFLCLLPANSSPLWLCALGSPFCPPRGGDAVSRKEGGRNGIFSLSFPLKKTR